MAVYRDVISAVVCFPPLPTCTCDGLLVLAWPVAGLAVRLLAKSGLVGLMFAVLHVLVFSFVGLGFVFLLAATFCG